MKIEEGYMPFLGYKTYYRIVGTASKDKMPLLLLHGGPGSTHNYFEVLDRLGEIHCPCLLFSGSEDLCTPAVARAMYEGIPGSRWELMEGARHMCFVDRHEDYCRILESWLEEHDPA